MSTERKCVGCHRTVLRFSEPKRDGTVRLTELVPVAWDDKRRGYWCVDCSSEVSP